MILIQIITHILCFSLAVWVLNISLSGLIDLSVYSIYTLSLFDWRTTTTGLNPRLNNLGPRGNLHVSILHKLVKGCDHISLSQSVGWGFICIRSQSVEIRPFIRPTSEITFLISVGEKIGGGVKNWLWDVVIKYLTCKCTLDLNTPGQSRLNHGVLIVGRAMLSWRETL